MTRLDNFTLTLNRGEIIGVAGVEGNGQSELAAVLSGMLAPTDGRFFVQDRELTYASPKAITAAGIGVVPEDRHTVGCITGMTVAENIFLNRLDLFTRYGFLRRNAVNSAAARADAAASTCGPRGRRSRFRASRAETSRRRCWRAS